MARFTKKQKPDAQAGAVVDEAPGRSDAVRRRCCDDLKFFYQEVLDTSKRGTGKVHDLLFDFLRLHELDSLPPSCTHSRLRDFLPARVDGEYPERWLYFTHLSAEPEIQDGSTGHIASLFHGDGNAAKIWKGIILRIKGDGKESCTLLPRGHLKTELAVVAKTIWEMCRTPRLRHVILCANASRARQRVGQIKSTFERNPALRALFGELIPTEDDDEKWNQTELLLKHDGPIEREATLTAASIESGNAGMHCNRLVFDDVVDEKNSTSPTLCEKIALAVEQMTCVVDPGSHMCDIGTIYNDNDAHGRFFKPEYGQSEGSSLLVATLTDANGDSLWPEVFTEKEIARRRKKIGDDRMWFAQYYNQPVGGAVESLDPAWVKDRYDQVPARLVVDKKLNIFVAVDPASTSKKKSDHTACTVMGQTQDGKELYLLDGIRERLAPNQINAGLMGIISFWQDIAIQAQVSFRVGFESYSFQIFLKKGFEDAARLAGRSFHIEELTPRHRDKDDRIKVLQTPFAAGRIHLPKGIRRISGANGREYDLIQALMEEYTRWPNGQHDDVLDTMAYIVGDMARPGPSADVPDTVQRLAKDEYRRDEPDEQKKQSPAWERLYGREGRAPKGTYVRAGAEQEQPQGPARYRGLPVRPASRGSGFRYGTGRGRFG